MENQEHKCIEIGYIKSGRSDYECFGCLRTIKKNEPSYYIKMVSKEKLEKSRMCPKCTFLITTKQKNTGNGLVSRGQFQEHRLASPLKAAWKEALTRINEGKPVFDADPIPKAVIARPIRIITTAEDFIKIYNGKKFISFPARHCRRKFEVGGTIKLSKGVSGDTLNLKILRVGVWSRATCKKMYGTSKKHYVIRVEREIMERSL